MTALLPELPRPGFNFENYHRNEYLHQKGFMKMKATSTGTTIAGCLFRDGVIIGADQRATAGTTIVEKDCEKIHDLAPNMVYGGAGTAADTDKVSRMIKSQLELHRLNSGKEVPVCVAITKITQHLFRYQGHKGCALVLGGVDKFGKKLVSIAPHGSVDPLPFTSMGSGSLAAISVLENGYKEDMEEEEAAALIRDAITAGIENDLASGSSVDLCIIKKGSKKVVRSYYTPPSVGGSTKFAAMRFKPGATPILESKTIKIEIEDERVQKISEPMDTA